MNKTALGKVLFPALIVVAVLVLLMPRARKFGKEYQIGRTWEYETLVSQFDFPILKTEEQIRKEKLNAEFRTTLCFKASDENFDDLLAELKTLNIDEAGLVKASGVIREIYSKGVIADYLQTEGFEVNPDVIYVQKDKHAEKIPFSNVLSLSRAKALFIEKMCADSSHNGISADYSRLSEVLTPNLVLDMAATEMMNNDNSSEVSPTSGYFSAGQVVIEQGEVITARTKQLLDSYKSQYEAQLGYDRPLWLFWIGNLLIALTLVSILIGVIYFTNKEVLLDSGRYSYILTIFLIASASAILVGKGSSDYAYMVPFTLVGLYLQAFFRNRVIVPVFIVSLFPLLLFVEQGVVLFVMFSLAGIQAIYSFRYFGKGWRQFVNALLTFAVLVLVFVGFYALDFASGDIKMRLLYLFIASMLSVAGYPLVFLFEKIFNLVSSSRLAELCDSSNPLLRELESKAPGTFQHSLQVQNMVETVARAIGANEQLLRAGAMYHDIGKMANPMCFVENESMHEVEGVASYHSNLTPLHSAQDILRHVSDGVEIAKKHRLPKPVIEMIQTHHGTTTAMYFLNKYQEEGGDPALLSEFRYPGPNPSSKEQIVLMLCDSIEAASRTLKDKKFDDFVEKMVSLKMEAGQFENADITIRELGIVKETIKNYLVQLYHGRIEYPKDRKHRK